MLKEIKTTQLQNRQNHYNPNRRGKRANKNIRQSRKRTKKQTKKNISLDLSGGGCDNQIKNTEKKEQFQITTFRSLNQDDLDRFKISNYVNTNIDWGDIIPGPPPTDCVIM